MSDLELLSGTWAAIIALVVWAVWYHQILRVHPLVCPRRDSVALLLLPILCALLVFIILRTWASDDVRDDTIYLGFYTVIGAGWLGVASLLIPFLGISTRDDVLERRNRSATWVVSGALSGITLCYAGANIGNGPGVEAVLFCALLATVAFFVFWLAAELLTSISETITVERSFSAGIRIAGFLLGLGIILGKSVAGDWVSFNATVNDFIIYAWPVLPLTTLAIIVERAARAKVTALSHPFASGGIGAGYVTVSVLYVVKSGI